MKKFWVIIIFLGNCIIYNVYASDSEVFAILNEMYAELEENSEAYMEKYIIPQLEDGKGQSKSKPIVFTETPVDLSPDESRALTFANAGFFCQKPEHDDIWVRFPAFNKRKTSKIKELVGLTNRTQTTLQCSNFLQEACKNGSCISGQCGQNPTLSAFCSVCDQTFPGSVDDCIRDYNYRQALPNTALRQQHDKVDRLSHASDLKSKLNKKYVNADEDDLHEENLVLSRDSRRAHLTQPPRFNNYQGQYGNQFPMGNPNVYNSYSRGPVPPIPYNQQFYPGQIPYGAPMPSPSYAYPLYDTMNSQVNGSLPKQNKITDKITTAIAQKLANAYVMGNMIQASQTPMYY